jgi:hypothetical protein
MAVAEITKPKEYWLDLLGEMDDGAMAAYTKESETLIYWEEDYPDELDTDEARAKFYQYVAERVNDAIKVCYSDSREGGWFSDGEKKWYVTGGMSWGDDPTDIFNDVRIVDSFQYFWQLGAHK